MNNIVKNLIDVRQRIEKASRKAGRAPEEITLVAVTKDVDIEKINKAIRAGHTVFGENYVQEAREKIEKFKKKPLKWHFIGGLQKNKAKYAVQLFDVIESVDSYELAVELSKRAEKAGRPHIDILIEVNIAREKNKAGVDVREIDRLVKKISELPNLRIRGFMAIPPQSETPETSRPYFITLRRIAERINREHLPNVSMHELSMGMSHDFEVAIEEGATIIRVGRAIFGEREKKKTRSNV